jgi:hypothetical protein
MARNYGVEELLPWSRKKSEVKQARRELYGVRVRGTGVGQQVKGHIWERQMISKMEKRRDAMVKMPEMIKEWKTVSLSMRMPMFRVILMYSREDMAKDGRNGQNEGRLTTYCTVRTRTKHSDTQLEIHHKSDANFCSLKKVTLTPRRKLFSEEDRLDVFMIYGSMRRLYIWVC